MSILKSTNTGRCSIKVDEAYLLSKGWYYKNFPAGGRDNNHIYKDDKHFLTLIDFDLLSAEIIIVTFHEETDNWVYNTIIASLVNLDDVEKFWKDREEDFEKAETEFLAKYPGCKSPNVVNMIQQDATDAINEQIHQHIIEKLAHIK